MAFKVAPRKSNKIFEVGVKDEALRESLNAGKKNFVLKGRTAVHDEYANAPEEEPLPEDLISKETDNNNLSYASANSRLSEVEINNDPEAIKARKKMSRKITGRKFFETVISIILVIAIGVFVMLLLYPQTEISELARDNSNLKDQINTTRREIVKAEENANGIADMDVIRAQALALGMQDPNQNQVINLPVPNTDSLRTNTNYNTEGISNEVYNDSKDALADYYAAHPDK